MHLKLRLRYYWRFRLSLKLASWLPKSVAMWSFYIVGGELDPDAMTREMKAVDIVDEWAEYHGLNDLNCPTT